MLPTERESKGIEADFLSTCYRYRHQLKTCFEFTSFFIVAKDVVEMSSPNSDHTVETLIALALDKPECLKGSTQFGGFCEKVLDLVVIHHPHNLLSHGITLNQKPVLAKPKGTCESNGDGGFANAVQVWCMGVHPDHDFLREFIPSGSQISDLAPK